MEVVSSELLELLTELQSLDSLKTFGLAGGTNLSIRFNHRESIDIDLFSNENIGLSGLQRIEQEVRDKYQNDVLYLNIENPGFGEQYCFIKSVIKKGDLNIKVEVLQNIQMLYPLELVDKIKLVSIVDIGIMKLESLASRKAKKDVYDLDTITDEISLENLFEELRIKKEKYQEEQYKSLFDLDESENPIDNPLSLLEFDSIQYQSKESRPSHSNDNLKINDQKKKWVSARTYWKRKVSKYCRENNIEVPPAKSLN